MGVPKLYLETTMFNFYYLEKESEKRNDTLALFKRIAEGWFEPYTSNIVVDELKKAETEQYLKMFGLIEQYGMEVLTADAETRKLADIYIKRDYSVKILQ